MAEEKVISTNRKAFHDYAILETYEAGLVLKGTELEEVPAWLRKCRNLDQLDLTDNLIDSLPDWIKECKELRVLLLKQNLTLSVEERLLALDDLIRFADEVRVK